MTTADDNHETEDFRPRGAVQTLFRGCDDPRVRVVVWTFVFGSVAHLWLADAAHPDWLVPNIVYVLGLIVLGLSGGPLGWLLSGAGLIVPLLFLRDQLTQSVFLLAVCAAGALFTHQDARRPRIDAFIVTLRALTIVTYAAAAFHKLNRQFLDPVFSCANYGIDEVVTYWNLDPAWLAPFDGIWPTVATVTELSVPLFYLLGRRHFARIAAVVFHIPLTMTMAPAFAFVMAVGHAAFITDEERRVLWRGLRGHAPLLLGSAALATAVSLAMHGALPEPFMIPREFLLWLCLFWFLRIWPPSKPDELRPRGMGRYIVVGVFVLNCLTPYTGLQYQHAAAMLSNLRIDEGCWNHYIVPEAVRLTDEYVRVESTHFGAPGRITEYEDIVLDQLWSPPQILQMRRNWCRPEIRPFFMSGTYRSRSFTIADVCDEGEAWPFDELFPGFLRFQKNLQRDCPQLCIH